MTANDFSSAGEALGGARRIVVKIGSATLCDRNGVRTQWLAALAGEIARYRQRGIECVIVASGAIALGCQRLNLSGDLRLDEKQAASAAGQAALMSAWQNAFDPHRLPAAQILLTLDDTEDRRRYINARGTLKTLLGLGAIPIVNENDTVATSEIRYGDNDRLAAHAAQLVSADCLVILSDIDGFYSSDPRINPDAEHLATIPEITPAIEASAGKPNPRSGVGSGGMASKIAAAKIATNAGCAVIIADGGSASPLEAIEKGARSTLIRARQSARSARAQWISGRLKTTGSITIDAGAETALKGGASLLPAGVCQIDGAFRRGDAVAILDQSGNMVGRGLITYDVEDLAKLIGKKSGDIDGILGYSRRPAAVEKNDLVLTKEHHA